MTGAPAAQHGFVQGAAPMLLLSFLIGLIAAGESALQPCHRPLELVRARYHGDRRSTLRSRS